MNIEQLTSRKFIAFIITLAIFIMVFIGTWMNSLLSIDFLKHYLFWLVMTVGLYLGVNLFEGLGEKVIDKFLGKEPAKNEPTQE